MISLNLYFFMWIVPFLCFLTEFFISLMEVKDRIWLSVVVGISIVHQYVWTISIVLLVYGFSCPWYWGPLVWWVYCGTSWGVFFGCLFLSFSRGGLNFLSVHSEKTMPSKSLKTKLCLYPHEKDKLVTCAKKVILIIFFAEILLMFGSKI